MDSELRDLYQDLILDHGKTPRNHKELPGATATAEGNNPLCGDKCRVYATISGDEIADVSFLGKGCAISQASASLMTQAVKGHTCDEARSLFERLQRMVKDTATEDDLEALGKLAALAGVKEFPMRVKCATLPWHTLLAAINQETKPISTE
jgi:nitrogen fixation NifU-like protein